MQLPPPAELAPRFARLLRLGIVAATVVVLARAMEVSLGPLFTANARPGEIVVRAETPTGELLATAVERFSERYVW